jgi:MFS family permease
MIVSMTGLIKAGFGPVSGFLSDTYGRKKLATIGASSIAVSMLLVYLASSTAMLVVGFLLYGVGQAMFFLSMMTSMVEAAGPEKRAIAMGLYEGGNGIAIMIGSAASSQLVSILGVAAVFGVAAAFSGISVLIIVFTLKETSTPSTTRGPILDLKGIRKLISPTYVAAMYTAFLFMYCQGGYSTIMPLYVTQNGLLDVAGLALLFVGFSGAGSLSALVTGPISDRVGRRVPIIIGMALTALSYIGLYTASSSLMLVASSLLLGFGASFFHPVASALVADISTPENRGKAFGFYRLLRDFGMFLGPMVAGVVATLLGIGVLFILNAALAAIGCLIAVLVIKETHPRE